LVKLGAKMSCRFERITALKVVSCNEKVRSLLTMRVGQVLGGVVEKVHSPKGANGSAGSVINLKFREGCLFPSSS